MYDYNKVVLDSHVFNFIYGCALHDAVLQKAFKGERKWIEGVTDAKNIVKDYINDVISGKLVAEDKHEETFLETAKKVCIAINDPKNQKPASAGYFSFGNAQKLINMVTKHVYAHTYSIHLASNSSVSIRDNFKHCHCPMDSIMLENIMRIAKDNKIELTSNFCKPWGEKILKKMKMVKKNSPQDTLVFKKPSKK